MRLLPLAVLVTLTALPTSLAAKVTDSSDAGFAVAHTAQVAATPDDVWTMLRAPEKWWSSDHSWSGDAKNFWMDMQAGGCFCETLPGKGEPADKSGRGSVQHARIILAKPGRTLRMSGALGPLQGEAMTGTMTISIAPTTSGGSAIRFDYVVGGYMRLPQKEISVAVDTVIGEQLTGLAKALGGALPVAKAAAKPDVAPSDDSGLDAIAKDAEAAAESETP